MGSHGITWDQMGSRVFFENSKDGLKKKSHPIIVCWKLTTPNNLGSILRIADNMACEKVLFVDENPKFKYRNIKKTAQISFKAIDWHFCTPENWKPLENPDLATSRTTSEVACTEPTNCRPSGSYQDFLRRQMGKYLENKAL